MSLNIQPNNPMPGVRQGEPQRGNASILGDPVRFESYAGVTWCNLRLPQRLSRRTQSGFTLVELMVVIVVLAILASIGIPGFQGIVAENRATSAANELLATLQFARSAAIAQSRPVTVRPTADGDWDGGWVVEMGESPNLVVLRESPALRASISLDGVSELRFSSTGTLPGYPPYPVIFDLEVDSGPGATRTICVTLGGSSKVIRGDTCD